MDQRFEHFNKEKLQMANEHEKCLVSLVNREKQSKSTVRYYYLLEWLKSKQNKQQNESYSNAGKVME